MKRAAAVGLMLLGLALSTTAVASPQPQDLQALVDSAPAGSTLHLDGTYRGGVRIEKPLKLDGSAGAVIDAGGGGNGITVDSADVTLRDLVIRNTGDSIDQENAGISIESGDGARITGNRLENVLFGIFIRGAEDSLVADNVVGAMDLDLGRRGDGIRLFESSGTVVERNVVHGGRDCVMWFSTDLRVRDNDVRDGRYGLHFMYSDGAVLERNRLEANSVGLFLMYSRRLTLTENLFLGNRGPSGYGVGLKDMDGVEATGNRFVGNRIGLSIDNSPWSHDVHQHFTKNLFAFNDIGIQLQPSVQRNHFSENAFVDNREQVGLSGSGVLRANEWTDQDVGNYWSDFAGFDAAGDGIGDITYRIDDLFSSLTDDNPELTFFAGSPAATAMNLAAEAFPSLRPDPKVVDEAPLIDVPDLPPAWGAETGSSSASSLAVGLGLLGLASVLVLGALRPALRLPFLRRHREATT